MSLTFSRRMIEIWVKSNLVLLIISFVFPFHSTFSFNPSNAEGGEKSSDLQIVHPRISTTKGRSSKITGSISSDQTDKDEEHPRNRIRIEVDCPRCHSAGALLLIELDPGEKQSDFIGGRTRDGSEGLLKSEWISAEVRDGGEMRKVVKKKGLENLSCDFYVTGIVQVVYYHTFSGRNDAALKEMYGSSDYEDRKVKKGKETMNPSKLALTICERTYVTGYVNFDEEFEFSIRSLNETRDNGFGRSSKFSAAVAHDLVSYRLQHSNRGLRKRSASEFREKNMDEDTTLREPPFNITQSLKLMASEPSGAVDQWLFNLTGDTFEIDLPDDIMDDQLREDGENEVDVGEIEFKNHIFMFDDRRQQQKTNDNTNNDNNNNLNLEENPNESVENTGSIQSNKLDEKSHDVINKNNKIDEFQRSGEDSPPNLEELLSLEVVDNDFQPNSSSSPFLSVDSLKIPKWPTKQQWLLEKDEEEVGYFYDTAWTADLMPISGSKQGDSSEIENEETREQRWLKIAIAVDYTLIAFHGRDKVESYVLALMNIVNAIYQDASLNANIKLVVSRLLVYENKKHSVVRPGNAKKSLENVNMWNKRLHASLAPWEPHHDMAIWLTRQDIGGPSGYAPVGGVCDPKRSCALNRDEGLSSAFIIAHEMAHILGLSHDGDEKHSNDCDKDGQRGSVMAPLVTATFSKFAWSECSKTEFKKTITKWSCLSNPPVQNSEEIVLNSTLQNTFSMDEQCRMEFGEGYILCRAFDIIEPCSHLWCGHEKSPLVCKTKKGSPLEGTKCGFHKWCVNGYCQNSATAVANNKPIASGDNIIINNEDSNSDLGGGEGKAPVKLNPRSGGWSKWSPWGACSRSCAIGVQFQTRKCDNPKPLHGGRNCIGISEKWKTCNKQPCPEPLEDPRAQQCKKMPKFLDLSKTNVANLTWLPYESDDIAKKCKLICISEETKELFESSENLIDGTPCSYENSDHICVQGVCHFLGCDSKPFSNMKTDSCGVCGGNNSTCSVVKLHSHKKLKRELSRIAVLPRMATQVELEANVTMHNRSEPAVAFILKNRRKKKYKITVPNTGINTEILEGTKFYYERTGNRHKIWANGPVLAEMVILVYAPGSEVEAGLNVSLISKYTINKNEDERQKMKKGNLTAGRFEWIKGGWGPCSASCGGGKRQQTLACWDRRDRKLVRRKHCSLTNKPAFKYDRCNEFECNFEWIAGEWEPCTTTCGLGGFQERQLYCVPQAVLNTMLYKSNGSLIDQPWTYMVSPRKCSPEIIPAERRPCNRVPCFSYWTFGEWSQCSTTCGEGVSFRSTHCPPPHSEQFFTCGDAPSENLLQRLCYNTYGKLDRRFYECRKLQNINKRANGKKLTCEKDKSVFCHLDVLSKYCHIRSFRRLCCKSCHNDISDHQGVMSAVMSF